QVDDIGAAREGHLGLCGIAHARKEQGHGRNPAAKKKSTVEQPVENPAASAATTTATPACCTATRGTTLWTRAALGSAPATFTEIAPVHRTLVTQLVAL